jgi:hypothetical protein
VRHFMARKRRSDSVWQSSCQRDSGVTQLCAAADELTLSGMLGSAVMSGFAPAPSARVGRGRRFSHWAGSCSAMHPRQQAWRHFIEALDWVSCQCSDCTDSGLTCWVCRFPKLASNNSVAGFASESAAQQSWLVQFTGTAVHRGKAEGKHSLCVQKDSEARGACISNSFDMHPNANT